MDAISPLYTNVLLGLSTALAPQNLFYCFVGVVVGMLVGVLPGIGAMAAISMLFPLTFYLDPTAAIIMLAGIYYGTAYGGSTTSILLNIPGEPSSAVTAFDGYPMAQKGRAGAALMVTTLASFIGGSVGIIFMMLFSPIIVSYALQFGAWEYFALMVLGLVAASAVSEASVFKSLAMVVFGIIFGTVGIDIYTGVYRFDFGSIHLRDGISLEAFAMGLFGVSEVIASIRTVSVEGAQIRKVTFRSMILTRNEVKRSAMPVVRGTLIGSVLGALPGTGATIASFLSYAVERRVSRRPDEFGKGAIEGVASPEAANNAAGQTAFIPTMALGIPGTATMAIMLSALVIQGITPGPMLMAERPDIFWGLIMSFWVGNVMLLALNIPLIGVWVSMLRIPYGILYPAVLLFVCIGVYSVKNSSFDVWAVLFFGVVGYLMRLGGLPLAPMVLGIVLGPMMEEHFRRGMLLSRGDFMDVFTRPISGAVMAATLALLLWGLWRNLKKKTGVVPITEVD
ncbi:tripartite tricarboxylate transporter permease [Mesorhizobium sp. YR577]|uniref:tripartite tricarboxylate transporter permease n=1 Tax=Mesorhizobium sp. YR577 TaxID=1884373 RepID=UPI0008F42EF8|nr:tripartite tricarboxylate transporter permease [Mesorhizobium sp. YR577]SFU22836.1 TctA family transporter [Mesorhizobium sp. YR577]